MGGLGVEAHELISWIMKSYNEARATQPKGEVLRRLTYSTSCAVMRGTYAVYQAWIREALPHFPPVINLEGSSSSSDSDADEDHVDQEPEQAEVAASGAGDN